MPDISPATRLFVLLGDPVVRSLSPRIHNAAIATAGLDAVYVALRCSTDDVPGLIRAIARAGGGGNVTVPHKGVAASAVEEPTPLVVRTGACNTFWLEDGRVHGDNTDVEGFLSSARELAGDLAGARVLVVGAGGGARAVVAALLGAGVERIALRNRSRVRAEALLAVFGEPERRLGLAADDDALRGEPFDLVVNATTLGSRAGDPLPVDPAALGRLGAVLDLVYSPAETALVHAARGLGVLAADGKGMLLGQAAASFQRWWGMPAPIDAMKQAL